MITSCIKLSPGGGFMLDHQSPNGGNNKESFLYLGKPNVDIIEESDFINPSIMLQNKFGIVSLITTHTTVSPNFFGIGAGSEANDAATAADLATYAFGTVRSMSGKNLSWVHTHLKITAISRVGNVVTVSVNYRHFLTSGEHIEIVGFSEAGFNGVFPVTVIPHPSNNYFSYISPLSNADMAPVITAGAYGYCWDYLDSWVALHHNANRDMIYSIQLTPTWAAAGIDTSPSGGAGWNREPLNYAYLYDFCTLVATRYRDKGQFIKYWEVYNEPNYQAYFGVNTAVTTGVINTNQITVASITGISMGMGVKATGITTTDDVKIIGINGNVLTLSQNNVGTVSGSALFNTYFWGGTISALSQCTRIINQAVKAIWPTAKIISSPVTNLVNTDIPWAATNVLSTYFPNMMNASDGNGGIMSQWVDVVGIHLYLDAAKLPTGIKNIQTMLTTLNLNIPMINTESGIKTWNTDSDYNLYRYLVRQAIVSISFGIVSTCFYQLGKTGEIADGYSLGFRQNCIRVISDLYRKISLYGIDSAAMFIDGSVAFRINGQDYTV